MTPPNSSDDFETRLRSLSGGLPEPRLNLTEADKDALIARVGPRTARNVVGAKKDAPVARIPFLFSSLNTQDVVDLLANNVDAALARALKGLASTKRSPP